MVRSDDSGLTCSTPSPLTSTHDPSTGNDDPASIHSGFVSKFERIEKRARGKDESWDRDKTYDRGRGHDRCWSRDRGAAEF